jgi:hypothetical protein
MVREVELVIPSPFEATHLLRFLYQVEEELDATIVREIGSWNKGTAINVVLRKPQPLTTVLDMLREMAEVEAVVGKPATERKFSRSPLKSIAKSENHVGKEILVTLK